MKVYGGMLNAISRNMGAKKIFHWVFKRKMLYKYNFFHILFFRYIQKYLFTRNFKENQLKIFMKAFGDYIDSLH